jgi:TolA-binding protein
MIRFPWRPARSSCPAGWEITQALSQPETRADVVAHLRACPACAALAAELSAVVSAAAELPPVAPMTPAARERIRQALGRASAAATQPTARRPRVRLAWVFAAGLPVIAVALGGWWFGAREPRVAHGIGGEPAPVAKLRAFGEASFHRLSGPPDEIVRLEAGRVAFAVARLSGAQRFRVVTRDGEVEVRGTRFEAEARDGALWAVAVSEGSVEVRVGGVVLRLQAGDEWQRQRPSSAPSGSALVAGSSEPELSGGTPTRGAGAAPAERARSSNRQSFDLAWAHLRRRDWEAAERGFAAVAAQARGQALEEDALYWQAVATARAGRAPEASQRFAAFLARFPAGTRTGPATLALAWLSFDAGEREQARTLFERAARDSSAKVRQGAEEGLARLRAR